MITVMREPNEYYMHLAIEVAQEARDDGGVAIGAVLVKESDGQIIASGGSIVGILKDPTAHAEVNCIRAASALLKTDDMFEYTLFSTLEPCHMCLSAAAWARIYPEYFLEHTEKTLMKPYSTLKAPSVMKKRPHI